MVKLENSVKMNIYRPSNISQNYKAQAPELSKEEVRESCCKKLGMTSSEEVFLSIYNPLVFYARLRDTGKISHTEAKELSIQYEPFYIEIMKKMGKKYPSNGNGASRLSRAINFPIKKLLQKY